VADHRYGAPRDMPEQAPFDVIDRIEDTLLEAPVVAAEAAKEVAEQAAEQHAQQAVRRNWTWTNLAAMAVSIVVAIASSLIVYYVLAPQTADAQTAADRAILIGQSAKQTVDDALAKLKEANDELAARGQAPVTTPPDPDPAEAIRAAVLAKVLAQLPPTPTAAQVAAVLQPAVSAQVTGPSRDTLAQLVADYFAQNPTAAQIQAAVDSYLSAHPPERGPQGDPGIPGESPPCLSEPTQCRGVDGTNGTNGVDGKDSTVPGPPGPPPAGWSWPDPVIPNLTHVCTRSGGTDDAALYSCS
jgi:hypothetical protein